MTEAIDIELMPTVTADQVKQHLDRFYFIGSAIVNANRIIVAYNPQRIAGKRILKLVQQASGTGKRDRNVRSVRAI